MEIEKYTPNSLSVSAILGLIASGDIAVPEIQRPFVWKRTQVQGRLCIIGKDGILERLSGKIQMFGLKMEVFLLGRKS